MGFSDIVYLIKERINMIKQLQEVSLKSLDMINKNAEGINKLAEFLHENQSQLNMLATKVMELEKRLEPVEDGLERVVKKQVEDYERPKN